MGSVCCKSDTLPGSVVLCSRVSIAGSAALITSGVLFGGDHGLPSHPVRMLRIAVFGTLFGSQMWNTFISGPVLFKTQPRHTFGEVQTYLLPAYFNLTTVLSAAAMGIHLYYNPYSMWTKCERTFTLATGTALLCSIVQSSVLMGINTDIMNKMFAIEETAGLGQEVGYTKSEKLKENEEYKKLKKCFGMAHGTSALVNLLSLGTSVIQLVYFAQHGF